MDINLIREDTETIKIQFKRYGAPVIPNGYEDGDIFTLTLRDRNNNIILTKEIEFPDDEFKLTSKDTHKLVTSPYRYDIEYKKPNKDYVAGTDELFDRYLLQG